MRNNLIYDFFNVISEAHSIKQDEIKRKKSVRFAVISIIFSLMMIACAAGGAFIFTISDSSLLVIFLIVIAVGLLGGAVMCFLGALLRAIAQLIINRKAISWIALVVLIISVAVSAVIVIKLLG